MNRNIVVTSIAPSDRTESNKGYFLAVIGVCFLYLVIQWCYIPYAIFSIDDFWLAYHTNHYKTGLPYRDFSPYKSVLGYYIFLLPFCLFHGVLSPLLYAKAWIALINTVFLGGISLWMKRFFSNKAIITSLVLIISTPIFLLFSSEIRVDLLSYWLCLMSVLFLFEKKYVMAGISIGVGFLISQKVVWYIFATNIGLMGHYAINERTWKMIKNIVVFNAGSLLILSLYIIFWSYYSSVSVVLKSLFYEAYIIQGVDWYVPLRSHYWDLIITYSLELILLWPLALIGLFFLPVKNRIFIIIYTSVILGFIISCKQAFYYFPLVGVPALFVLLSAFFSSLYSYCYAVMHVHARTKNLYFWTIAVFIFCVAIAPLSRFVSVLSHYNGHYQKSMIYLMADLLKDGGGYIAGSPLLLHVEQPIPGLKHLIAPEIEYMYKPSKKLYSILTLSSLYLTPATVPELIESIKSAPVKLYVDNNRFHYLPKTLFRYLDTQYKHFWGSIYLYAPTVSAGHHIITVKFSGHYKVISSTVISIDTKQVAPGSIIHLTNRQYLSDASMAYRLELIPEHIDNRLLEPRYKKNYWNMLL